MSATLIPVCSRYVLVDEFSSSLWITFSLFFACLVLFRCQTLGHLHYWVLDIFLIPVGDLELGSGMQSIGPSGSSCFVRWTVAVLTLGPATLHC